MTTKRKVENILRYIASYGSAIICLICLLGIILYIFINGIPNLSFKLITSDYESTMVQAVVNSSSVEFYNPNIEGTYFSKKYGISLSDGKATDGSSCIYLRYIDANSPFKEAKDKTTGENLEICISSYVDTLMGIDKNGDIVISGAKNGAEEYAKALDMTEAIMMIQLSVNGGGIRGSIITTLMLILLTLLFAIPLGIGAAIYLELYAKKGKIKNIISQMIDMISGIPSIIFGFVGAVIFIPFVSCFGASGYSILAGTLTMAIVLLPTIIKTAEEAIRVVPKHYLMSSLALGASKTQTVFKVILPNAIPGILTAVLLSIGRIIGESAALIFVMGTSICDDISLLKGATSLSVHIWSICQGENPNYATACSISIIILIVVFVLSISVKLISLRLNRKRGI